MSQLLEKFMDPGLYTNGVFDASDKNEVDMTWPSWACGTDQINSEHSLLSEYDVSNLLDTFQPPFPEETRFDTNEKTMCQSYFMHDGIALDALVFDNRECLQDNQWKPSAQSSSVGGQQAGAFNQNIEPSFDFSSVLASTHTPRISNDLKRHHNGMHSDYGDHNQSWTQHMNHFIQAEPLGQSTILDHDAFSQTDSQASSNRETFSKPVNRDNSTFSLPTSNTILRNSSSMEPSDTGVHPASEGSSPSTGVVSAGEAAADMIVSVHRHDDSSGYIFRCSIVGCRNTTFRRWHDFERHDNTFHNGTSVLWCPEHGCSRSKGPRNKSFPKVRKDKLRDHVRKVHGYELDG